MPRKKLPKIIGYMTYGLYYSWHAECQYKIYCSLCGLRRKKRGYDSDHKWWQIRLGDLKMFSQECDSCRREINLEASSSMPQLFNGLVTGRRVKLPTPETIQRRK